MKRPNTPKDKQFPLDWFLLTFFFFCCTETNGVHKILAREVYFN